MGFKLGKNRGLEVTGGEIKTKISEATYSSMKGQ